MIRRALVLILDKSIDWLANHGPAKNSDESLPGELKRMLTRWRDYCAASEKQAEVVATSPTVGLIDRVTAPLIRQYRRWISLPRWLRIALLSGVPCLTAYIVFSLLFTAPPPANQEDTFRHIIGKPLVRIVYVREWPSSDIVSRLLGYVLRYSMNNDVLFKPVSVDDPDLLWSLLDNNQADLCASIWLPRTHKARLEALTEEVVDLGSFLGGARLGLAVPDYVKARSIGELKPADFDGVLYGIDPDSDLNHRIRTAFADYGIEGFKLIEKNDRLTIDEVEKAIEQKKNIVFAAWTPHWLFGTYKLRFLDDPLDVFGTPESVHCVVTKKFAKSFPLTTECLARFRMTAEDLSQLLAAARVEAVPGDAIRAWIVSHREQVSQWIEPMLRTLR